MIEQAISKTIDKTLAFVFPGQGSQTVGMLADIAEEFAEFKETFQEASAKLHYDLWQLVVDGPAEKLDMTIHTQPAILAASYAIWRIIYHRTSVFPAVLAGHSLGEYSALVCSGVLQFSDAVQIVSLRGKLMQEALVPGAGAMAAIIGLPYDAVLKVCQSILINAPNGVLAPANFNSPEQTVIAGHKELVLSALSLAKENGARKTILLPVSIPSHCQLMHAAAHNLAKLLIEITCQPPSIPVINNVDVAYYQNPALIADGLVRQLYSPVRWVETIQKCVKTGIGYIVECGPGKVLTGLNKRIDPNLKLAVTADLNNLKLLLTQFEKWSAICH